MKLEDVWVLVRDAREAIESGRVEDAAWLLEALGTDLAELRADIFESSELIQSPKDTVPTEAYHR